MRMLAVLAVCSMFVAGCSGVPSISFQDSNESILAVEVRLEVSRLDCKNPGTQLSTIKRSVDFLQLYSESKGSKDLQAMVLEMQDTTNGLYAKGDNLSPVFCDLKKKVLTTQSKDIADAVMRRF